jgi:hypothetical protein
MLELTADGEEQVKTIIEESRRDGLGRLVVIMPPKISKDETGNIKLERTIRVGKTDVIKGVQVCYWGDEGNFDHYL